MLKIRKLFRKIFTFQRQSWKRRIRERFYLHALSSNEMSAPDFSHECLKCKVRFTNMKPILNTIFAEFKFAKTVPFSINIF